MDKILENILKQVAEEEGVDIEEVEKILKLPYKQMRHHIIKQNIYGKTGDEAVDLKTNFNMPALFKLYLNKKKLDQLNIKEEKK